MSGHADYRKMNDHSHSSSTYHKKDGTAVRAKLSHETSELVYEEFYLQRKIYHLHHVAKFYGFTKKTFLAEIYYTMCG